MTNEEKAKEIIKMSETKQVYDIVDIKSLEEALYDDLMQMAKWKDEQLKEQRRIIRNHWQEWAEEQKQQLIDKACEWLSIHDNYSTPTHVLVEQLKQAMKGGE